MANKLISGSSAGHHQDTEYKNPTHPDRTLRVTIVLVPEPLNDSHPLSQTLTKRGESPVGQKKPLQLHQLSELFAPKQSHLSLVLNFARNNGLKILEVSRARHDVTVEASVQVLEKAFCVELHDFEFRGKLHHAHNEDIQIPEELDEAVQHIIGLDGTPRFSPSTASSNLDVASAYSTTDLTKHYNFPSDLDGKGQRIAIFSFGGGYYYSDLDDYFRRLLKIPAPSVRNVNTPWSIGNLPLPRARLSEIATAYSKPGVSVVEMQEKFGADWMKAIEDLEIAQDIQIAGAAANGADIDIYFSRGDDLGIYYSTYAALGLWQSSLVPRSKLAAISISWGTSECSPTTKPNSMKIINLAFEKAALLHVPVVCATGDFGSYGSLPAICGKALASVSFPASSPNALACGGTQFKDYSKTEVVWNASCRGLTQASGGGISGYWPLPKHQAVEDVPSHSTLGDKVWLEDGMSADFCGRGTPDVSAYADPRIGYQVVIGGNLTTGSGTSASTPLWAGLCARLAEGLGESTPWINEAIYCESVSKSFRQITTGNNDLSEGSAGSFKAHSGWNACTGLGVPDGTELLRKLKELVN